MKYSKLKHEFVEFIPGELEEGTLYVSIPYTTAVHKCACGCGAKVVTPISPAQWQLTFDGESVSLSPSIGNWQSACRSHYWIRNGKIRWAAQWTADEIAEGRERDQRELEDHFIVRESHPVSRPQIPSHYFRDLLGRLLPRARRRRS